MRTETTTTKILTFEELSPESQQTAIENFRNTGLDYEWWDCVYEDTKTIAELMGIGIDKIYFSGFSSQGDGACFEGTYSYKKGGVAAVKDHAPIDKELHRISKELQDIQRKNFYKIGANVKHSGRYSHENCTDIQVWSDNESMGGANDTAYYGTIEALRDFMRWIYKQLENEFDHINSDENITETIKVNEYEFTENGERY